MRNNDPDFVITLAGEDVTKFCEGWELLDDEEAMSSLTVDLNNQDSQLTDKPEIGSPLAIRFGYQGALSGQAEFPIMEIKPSFRSEGHNTISVMGFDESEKLSGERMAGNFDPGITPDRAVEELARGGGFNDVKVEGQHYWSPETPLPAMNEDANELIHKYGQMMVPPKGKGKGGKQPTGVMPKKAGAARGFNGKVTQGPSFSGASLTPFPQDPQEAIDRASLENQGREAQGEPVTASLILKGYPQLKAKKCITIVNVGDKYSGKWYVQKVRHSWRPSQGFRTAAELIRSGVGKGDAGANPPMVMYAEIYQKGGFYMGPRKLDGESQATFTYGDGTHVIEFCPHVRPQKDRGAGEGKGSAYDIDLFRNGMIKDHEAEALAGQGGE